MDLDDDICYCYHVPLRKLLHFARRTKPKHAAQMAECLGAGTGCGWCIPILRKITASVNEAGEMLRKLDKDRYATERETYRQTPAARNRFSDDTGAPDDARARDADENRA